MNTFKRLPTLVLAVLFSLSMVGLLPKKGIAQIDAPALSFSDPQLISGVWGELNSAYRFSSVTQEVDAIVTIQAMDNAELYSLDLESTGSYGAFQPQVNMKDQRREGTSAYMDFRIEFVNGGTLNPYILEKWAAVAIDIDGDDYRLREGVTLYQTAYHTLEQNTTLRASSNGNAASFEARYVTTRDGVDTTAAAHMVYAAYHNQSSFVYRTQIFDDGADDGDSDAADRMFSLNFNPALINFFDTPNSFPVEWAKFEAQAVSMGVQLDWSTFVEENNAYFEVETAVDGMNFHTIGTVSGAGTSTEIQHYSFTDTRPETGIQYYRLKQVDFDGNSSYSNTIEIHLEGRANRLIAYPNPAKDILTIENTGSSITGIQLLDMSGKVVKSLLITETTNTHTIDISSLLPGMYVISIEDEGSELSTQKVVIQ